MESKEGRICRIFRYVPFFAPVRHQVHEDAVVTGQADGGSWGTLSSRRISKLPSDVLSLIYQPLKASHEIENAQFSACESFCKVTMIQDGWGLSIRPILTLLPPKSRESQAPFCKTGPTLVPSTKWKGPPLVAYSQSADCAC